MAEVDPEFEMLSAFVDGELSADEETSLRHRLEAEPELAAAIEALRADRKVRAGLWASYEPDEASVQRLIDRVDRAIDRNTVWSYRLSKLRTAGAAAACIVLGILLGRITLGPGSGQTVDPIRPTGPVGQTNVENPLRPPTPVQVRIVDGRGNQVMLQPFNSAEDAQRFIQDLQQWQAEQEQIRNGGGGIVPATTERF